MVGIKKYNSCLKMSANIVRENKELIVDEISFIA